MSTVDTMTRHLADETLAAFADGRLRSGEREEVIGHLADCDECRAVWDMVSEAQQEGIVPAEPQPVPVVVHGNFGWRAAVGGLVAAAAVAAVMFTPSAGVWLDEKKDWLNSKRTGGVSELIDATELQKKREIQARLVGFPYQEYDEPTRGPGDDDPDAKMREYIKGAAEEVVQRKDTSVRAKALGSLLAGEPRQAVSILEEALANDPDNPVLLSDLAAAYLERRRWTYDEGDLTKALDAANRSLQLKKTADAAWNRALALEQIALDHPERKTETIQAWNDYLAIDPSSEWAEEVKTRHLPRL